MVQTMGCPEPGRLGRQHPLALQLEPAQRCWAMSTQAPPPEDRYQILGRGCMKLVSAVFRKDSGTADRGSFLLQGSSRH